MRLFQNKKTLRKITVYKADHYKPSTQCSIQNYIYLSIHLIDICDIFISSAANTSQLARHMAKTRREPASMQFTRFDITIKLLT